MSRGDYTKAESLYQRALAIWEKALGLDHPDVANALNNIANLYYYEGHYVKAEPLLQRALTIWEKALGPDHPSLAHSLINLGILYCEKGNYTKAEILFQRALIIREKALGPDHPDVALGLNNLAVLYSYRRDYAKAEALYDRALAILERGLDPGHQNVIGAFNNLATLHYNKADFQTTLAFLSRAAKASERGTTLNLAAGSERQKLAYMMFLSEQTDTMISLHVQSLARDAEVGSLAVATVLQRKGRVLDSTTDSIAALRRRADPQDRELIDKLTNARSGLSKLVLGGPTDIKPAEYQAEIAKLEQTVEELEANMTRRSAEFRAQSQPVTVEAIQAAIPNKAALVEFASYRPLNSKYTKRDEQFGESRYLVYVLRNQGEPAWVELGAAKTIDGAINALRQALRDPNRKDVKQLARAVEEKVFYPVRKHIGQHTSSAAFTRWRIEPDSIRGSGR